MQLRRSKAEQASSENVRARAFWSACRLDWVGRKEESLTVRAGCDLSCFGNPAGLISQPPSALRPSLTRGVPLSVSSSYQLANGPLGTTVIVQRTPWLKLMSTNNICQPSFAGSAVARNVPASQSNRVKVAINGRKLPGKQAPCPDARRAAVL